MKAGKPKDEIAKIADPLRGLPDHGPLIPRVLTAAYEELAGQGRAGRLPARGRGGGDGQLV